MRKENDRPAPPPPAQAPLTDEPQPKPPAKWKKVAARALAALLLAALLALAYVFLLLGEPDEEAKLAAPAAPQAIAMPMSAVEYADEQNLQNVADAFGEPVLALSGSGLAMQRARVSDTAFQGGYARRATITYALADGGALAVESLRPAAAVTLVKQSGFLLEAGNLYTLAGLNAAWMHNGTAVCVFGQSDSVAYAVTCPAGHDEELKTLLKQTTLYQPATAAQ